MGIPGGERVSLLEERCYVVGVILEERRGTVSGADGLPVQSSPVVVLRDAYFLDIGLLGAFYWDGQGLGTRRCCYAVAVAQGLFLKGLRSVDEDRFGGLCYELVPGDWCEGGCM